MRYVVDTNVAIVANSGASQAEIELVYEAARFLQDAMDSGVVLEDDRDLAMDEYKTYLSFAGQPGMGDEFFKWFVDHRFMPQHVDRVAIPAGSTASDHVPPAIAGLDPSDHKWIAIYRLGNGDFIVNAVDPDYSEWSDQLELLGIRVLELASLVQIT